MRKVTRAWLSRVSLLVLIFPAAAQEAQVSLSPGPGSETASASATTTPPLPTPRTFDEVIDRVVEREHLLFARMRNLRPLVETYLQNLKSDAGGNLSPVNDQYFLGRLDMSDGPEDVAFVDSGSGRSRFRKLTGMFSLHFQPLGFAQMVVPDTDLYRK